MKRIAERWKPVRRPGGFTLAALWLAIGSLDAFSGTPGHGKPEPAFRRPGCLNPASPHSSRFPRFTSSLHSPARA